MKQRILARISRLWKRNRDKDYPQLWYCMPWWTPARRFLKWLCGVTGHELSETEWGYGGGKYADRHCRWCDKRIQVLIESVISEFPRARSLVGVVGTVCNASDIPFEPPRINMDDVLDVCSALKGFDGNLTDLLGG